MIASLIFVNCASKEKEEAPRQNKPPSSSPNSQKLSFKEKFEFDSLEKELPALQKEKEEAEADALLQNL